MPPNLSSRSLLATRSTWSVDAHHVRITSFLTPAQESSRQVPTTEGAAFADHMNSLFIETSAMTAVGVREAFEEVVERILDTPELWTPATGQDAGANVNLGPDGPQPQSGCAC